MFPQIIKYLQIELHSVFFSIDSSPVDSPIKDQKYSDKHYLYNKYV